MAIKLKSALKIPRRSLLLASKAALFGAALYLLSRGSFHTLELLAFWLIALILYVKPIYRTLDLLTSFLLLIILSPIAVSYLETSGRYPFLLAVLFSFLFYVLLGIKQNIFLSRVRWHYLLYLSLSYALFLLFYAVEPDQGFISRSLLVGIALYALLWELYTFAAIEKSSRIRLMIMSMVLITIELLWAVSLLPLGFLNAAALTLISSFLVIETSLQYLKGSFRIAALRTHLMAWAALALVLLASTAWHLP